MFSAGAPGTDPFAAFGMGSGSSSSPDGFYQQQQQQWPGGGGFGQQQQQRQQPLQPQVVALPLTLEELYRGCTKRLKVRGGESKRRWGSQGLAIQALSWCKGL